MSTLHRTQIYIDESQMQKLRLEAARKKVAVSELIRQSIDTFLLRRDKARDWKHDSLTKAIGKVRLSVHDASARHDEYLYGAKS